MQESDHQAAQVSWVCEPNPALCRRGLLDESRLGQRLDRATAQLQRRATGGTHTLCCLRFARGSLVVHGDLQNCRQNGELLFSPDARVVPCATLLFSSPISHASLDSQLYLQLAGPQHSAEYPTYPLNDTTPQTHLTTTLRPVLLTHPNHRHGNPNPTHPNLRNLPHPAPRHPHNHHLPLPPHSLPRLPPPQLQLHPAAPFPLRVNPPLPPRPVLPRPPLLAPPHPPPPPLPQPQLRRGGRLPRPPGRVRLPRQAVLLR